MKASTIVWERIFFTAVDLLQLISLSALCNSSNVKFLSLIASEVLLSTIGASDSNNQSPCFILIESAKLAPIWEKYLFM